MYACGYACTCVQIGARKKNSDETHWENCTSDQIGCSWCHLSPRRECWKRESAVPTDAQWAHYEKIVQCQVATCCSEFSVKTNLELVGAVVREVGLHQIREQSTQCHVCPSPVRSNVQ